MTVTLFWYMSVSVCGISRSWSGAPVERVGHAPKCRSSAFTEGPEKSFRALLPNKIWRETVTRRAAQPKQKSELPQGA